MTTGTPMTSTFDPRGIRLGVVRGLSYGLFGAPGEFIPEAQALGARLVRVYLYWGQVEPEPGCYRWDVVDALLGQLTGDEEVWITLCSSSPWGTRISTDFQPQSPAHDQGAYGEFVRQVVRRCAGQVHYWQCNNEPSNTGLLWSGTAAEYITHLKTFYRAVKDSDPAAAVVLGGCGYDVLSSEEGSPARQFFDHLAAAGRDAFDLFSVHLYGDPASVPHYLCTARQFMRAHGYLKPVIVGEHAGPQPFEFPDAVAVMQQVFAAAFSEPPPAQSTGELAAQAGQDTPERRAMAALYARMSELPPTLQMFMEGCPAELEAKRHRLACRQVVQRTLLALAGGVHRTAYWNLAPEYPGPVDHLQMMHLLIGKLPLLGYTGSRLGCRRPTASTFALLADQLAGARAVTRVQAVERPMLHAFEADRPGRGPLLVLWDHRDAFGGEDEPPVITTWPWAAETATVTDVFGQTSTITSHDRQIHLPVSLTPLFVTEPSTPPGQAVS